jgi:hypothetical protein
MCEINFKNTNTSPNITKMPKLRQDGDDTQMHGIDKKFTQNPSQKT